MNPRQRLLLFVLLLLACPLAWGLARDLEPPSRDEDFLPADTLPVAQRIPFGMRLSVFLERKVAVPHVRMVRQAILAARAQLKGNVLVAVVVDAAACGCARGRHTTPVYLAAPEKRPAVQVERR